MSFNHLNQPIGFPLPDWRPPPMPQRVTLTHRLCRAEPIDLEKHAGDLFAAFGADSRGADWTYLPYGPFATFDAFREWMTQTCFGGDPLFFTFIDPASGRAVGVSAYLRITPAAGSIEIGHVHLSPQLQRTATATAAMYLVMDHAFSLGYRRYEWKCDSLNKPSRKAAERLGFTFEGIFRQATVYRQRNRDTAWFSILDREWPVLKSAFEQWLAPENFDSGGRQRERLADLTRVALNSSARDNRP